MEPKQVEKKDQQPVISNSNDNDGIEAGDKKRAASRSPPLSPSASSKASQPGDAKQMKPNNLSKKVRNQNKKKKNGSDGSVIKKKFADADILKEIEVLFNKLSDKDIHEGREWNYGESGNENEWVKSPPIPDVYSMIRSRNEAKKYNSAANSAASVKPCNDNADNKNQDDNESSANDTSSKTESTTPLSVFTDVHVLGLAANGIGLASIEPKDQVIESLKANKPVWIFVVPFVLVDEIAQVKVFRNQWGYSQCDLITITKQSVDRVEAPCKYFTKCSGCQLQHLSYQNQLKFKRNIVKNAFDQADKYFENFEVSQVIGSPDSLNYRTKLTPHFDLPKNMKNLTKDGKDQPAKIDIPIGFNHFGRRQVLDIEQCLIATDAVNRGLVNSRKETLENIKEYKRGATLLIRETNIPIVQEGEEENKAAAMKFEKDFVRDPKSQVTEAFDGLQFQFPASSFFQNNNLILPAFTGYARDEVARIAGMMKEAMKKNDDDSWNLECLVDAYCGAGLFGIACSKGFDKVIGIEISKESISCANNNAKLNNITNCDFMLGDATHIFKEVPYDSKKTAVIIDPPRKGSSPEFLDQLIAFNPAIIIYVACGVPAQARDLKYMLDKGALDKMYKIMDIQPFDLFPQTAH
ncbi:tRNA(m5U54)methyltransferase, partial [Mycoemilia scoparia]